jgi:hypothetical protein
MQLGTTFQIDPSIALCGSAPFRHEDDSLDRFKWRVLPALSDLNWFRTVVEHFQTPIFIREAIQVRMTLIMLLKYGISALNWAPSAIGKDT